MLSPSEYQLKFLDRDIVALRSGCSACYLASWSPWHRVALVTDGPVFALVKGHDRVSGTHSRCKLWLDTQIVQWQEGRVARAAQ